jgi:TrmH family RNA methyltransferase
MLTHEQRRLLAVAKTRHGRRKHGVSLCEGVRCCREAISRRPAWIRLAVCTDAFLAGGDGADLAAELHRQGKQLCRVSAQTFTEFAETAHPQGILLLLAPVAAAVVQVERLDDPFALVLDRISEPGNMGTILRTAWAFGLRRVWLTEGCADPFAPKTLRAGMGAQFALDVVQGPPLERLGGELRRLGCARPWLSLPHGGVPSTAPEFAVAGNALVIGNEAGGVADLPGEPSVSIPMPGDAESLNASQAATILLYEAVRRNIL